MRLHLSPSFGSLPLKSIDATMVGRWYAAQVASSLAPATVAKHYRLLHALMGAAVKGGHIVSNPCQIEGAGTDRSKRREPFTVDEIDRLAQAVPDRWRALILMAGWCGLRFGELAGLRVCDVDLESFTIRVTRDLDELDGGHLQVGEVKSEAGHRTVAMPPHLHKVALEHRNRYTPVGSQAPFFVGAKGGLLRRSNFRTQVFLPAKINAGIDSGKTFHDLRHSAGTLAAIAGGTIAELMARQGHASPAAAMRYQHALADRDALLAQRMTKHLAERR